MKIELFNDINPSYVSLKDNDIKHIICNNEDVKSYIANYHNKFSDFYEFLKNRLIDNMMSLNLSGEEEEISSVIFDKMNEFKLIDNYEAYQELDNEWRNISIDLEIIQTEGFSAVKKVEPNMVIKKKDNKEVEIQEGWVGRVIPFELVQKTILHDEYENLKIKESRLAEIQSEYQELIDSLSEEEKETVLNDAGDSFDAKSVKEQIKELDDEPDNEESLKSKLIKYTSLNDEEKELKRFIKTETNNLHMLTKDTIESLSDEKAIELLKMKWINPLTDSINTLTDVIINKLVSTIKSINDKYQTTFSEITEEIEKDQETLISLIDELEGDEFDMKGLSELKSLLKGD